MSERTPETDIDIPGAIPESERNTEGHLHKIFRKDADAKDGLFVTNKFDQVNEEFNEEDEEDKVGDDGQAPLFDDYQANVGCSVLNTIFGITLVIAMNMPGIEPRPEISVVIFIGSLMALCSSVSFVWFLTCFMETQMFADTIEVHIEEKKESDPEFAKHMKSGWILQTGEYVPNLEDFLNNVAEFQAQQEKERKTVDERPKKERPGPDNLGGSQISDGEDIIDDGDGGDTWTRKGEGSPTASGGTYVSLDAGGSSRSDPTKVSQEDSGIEMTKIYVPTRPVETPDPTAPDTPSKSILKKMDSLTEQKKKKASVSFAGKGSLFENAAQEQEFKAMADMARIKEDEEYAGEDNEEIVDDEPAKSAAKDPELPLETNDSKQSDSAGPLIQSDEEELSVDQDIAPEEFYDTLFSAAHLKVTFRKYKAPVQEKVPNGFDLDGMDEKTLSDIIPSRLIRKRILVEASKLATKIKTSPGGPRNPTLNGEREVEFGAALRYWVRQESVISPEQPKVNPDSDADDEYGDDLGLGAPDDSDDNDEV